MGLMTPINHSFENSPPPTHPHKKKEEKKQQQQTNPPMLYNIKQNGIEWKHNNNCCFNIFVNYINVYIQSKLLYRRPVIDTGSGLRPFLCPGQEKKGGRE